MWHTIKKRSSKWFIPLNVRFENRIKVSDVSVQGERGHRENPLFVVFTVYC